MPKRALTKLLRWVLDHLRSVNIGAVLAALTIVAVVLGLRVAPDLGNLTEDRRWAAEGVLVGVFAVVIGIIAVIAATRQLVLMGRDQQRIAYDLARRPDLRVGFRLRPPWEDLCSRCTVDVSWPDGAVMSDPLPLLYYVYNHGERSARDLSWTVFLPTELDSPALTDPKFQVSRDLVDGALKFLGEHAFLHPGQHAELTVLVTIPRGVSQFDITVNYTMADSRGVTTTLRITVREVAVMPGSVQPLTTP